MMMLGPDKKNMASLIVGKLNGELPPAKEDEQDDSAGLKAAMDKFISSVHAKDTNGSVAAMQDFLEMHESSEEEESPEEEKQY